MLDQVLWWTGLATWFALACVGAGAMFDWAADKIITSFWSCKEIFAFVADRLRKGRSHV